MENNSSRYKQIKKVGQGTYGCVYKSEDTLTKEVRSYLMIDCCCKANIS